jgi:cell division protein FtsB
MVVIIGCFLAAYFFYHVLLGERSYMNLLHLQQEISVLSKEHSELRGQRVVLENKVRGLRPDTMDIDLLEERVQYVLGYYHPETNIIVQ